jgi:hypothetical protein
VKTEVEKLRLNDFATAQAGGAHAHLLAVARTLYLSADWAQIDVPAPLGHIVGVANVVTGARTFAANLTYLCHDFLRKLQNLCCNPMILAE